MPRKEKMEKYRKEGKCLSCGTKNTRKNRTKCQRCADNSNNYRHDNNGNVKKEYREKANIWFRKRRKDIKQKVDEYKIGRGCADCGYKEYTFCLDFGRLKLRLHSQRMGPKQQSHQVC